MKRSLTDNELILFILEMPAWPLHSAVPSYNLVLLVKKIMLANKGKGKSVVMY